MTNLKKTLMISIAAITCAGSKVAAAQETIGLIEPNYRCDAAMMRADAREVACQGRCQDLSDTPSASQVVSPKTQCMQKCHDRCEATKARLASRPPCSKVPPNPDRCAAKLLGALSQLKFCQASCPSEPQDASVECSDRCNQGYGESAQRIQAMDVCQDGVFPVCVYQ